MFATIWTVTSPRLNVSPPGKTCLAQTNHTWQNSHQRIPHEPAWSTGTISTDEPPLLKILLNSAINHHQSNATLLIAAKLIVWMTCISVRKMVQPLSPLLVADKAYSHILHLAHCAERRQNHVLIVLNKAKHERQIQVMFSTCHIMPTKGKTKIYAATSNKTARSYQSATRSFTDVRSVKASLCPWLKTKIQLTTLTVTVCKHNRFTAITNTHR